MKRAAAVIALVFGCLGVVGAAPLASTTNAYEGYMAIPAFRVADTRPGFPIDDQVPSPKGELTDGSILRVPIAGRGAVPAKVAAVALNLTAPASATPGYLTVYACDSPQPSTSNLNLHQGTTVANIAFTFVGVAGDVCVFVRGTTHVVVDVVGYLQNSGNPALVRPTRVADTRPGYPIDDLYPNPQGERTDGTVTPIKITGRAGVPDTAKGAILNVTAPNSTTSGYVAVYACGTPRPNTSNLNLQTGQAVSNAVLTNIGTNGQICLLTRGTTHVVVDVLGYTKDTPDLRMSTRLVDTRTDAPIDDAGPNPKGEREDGTVLRVPVAGRGDVPVDAGAAVLNLTAPNAKTRGYLTVYPCDTRQPSTSNLNLQPGATVANAVITSIGPKGDVCVFTRGITNLIVDVAGFTNQPRPIDISCKINGTQVTTTLSQPECDALVAIYASNNGPNWVTSDRWNTASDPCTWAGVVCVNGTVTKLSLRDNNLTGPLASQIGNLTGLVELSVDGNGLTRIPNEVGYLANLRVLRIGFNQLTSVPGQLGNLSSLEDLTADFNPITTLPPQIGRLTKLTSLDFSDTNITTVPSELFALNELRELDLSQTGITSISGRVGDLTKLESLDLSDTGLTGLPSEIGNLANLRELFVVGTELTSLPTSIGYLTDLDLLDVTGNRLTALPTQIGNLTNLKELSASSNQLASVPAEVGKLTKITTLNLDDNELSALPDELGNLAALENASFNDNRFTVIPAVLSKLIGLRTLGLSDNQLSGDITGPLASLAVANNIYALGLTGNDCLSADRSVGQWLDKVSPGWNFCPPVIN